MADPIRRHPSLVPLSKDHHEALLLAQVLKRNAPPYRGMPQSPRDKQAYFRARFSTALQPHFRAEEDKLFPLLAGKEKEIDRMIDLLVAEHRQLETFVRDEVGEEQLVDHLDRAGQLLEAHIRREERQLFQWAQANCSAAELEEIGRLLTA